MPAGGLLLSVLVGNCELFSVQGFSQLLHLPHLRNDEWNSAASPCCGAAQMLPRGNIPGHCRLFCGATRGHSDGGILGSHTSCFPRLLHAELRELGLLRLAEKKVTPRVAARGAPRRVRVNIHLGSKCGTPGNHFREDFPEDPKLEIIQRPTTMNPEYQLVPSSILWAPYTLETRLKNRPAMYLRLHILTRPSVWKHARHTLVQVSRKKPFVGSRQKEHKRVESSDTT